MKRISKPEQNINFLKNRSFASNKPIFQNFEFEFSSKNKTEKGWTKKLFSTKTLIIGLSLIGIIFLLLVFVLAKDKVIQTNQNQPSPTPIPTLANQPGFLQELKNDQKIIEGVRFEEDNLEFPFLDWDIYISP